jgi:hypothetical protein
MIIMWNSDLNLIFGNLHRIGFLVLYTFLFSSLIGGVYTSTNASSDAYNSGYNHGCDDAEIFDVSKRYINQPEKGPSFHTETFMQGYYDGYDACTTTTSDGNIRLPGVETFRIDATIDFDRQAILESNGNNLGDAWFTINGQRYGEGTYYDMIDWVYDDDVEIRGINTNSLSKVLELPYSLKPGQDIQVCLNDDKGYHLCEIIVNSKDDRPEKVSFTYP